MVMLDPIASMWSAGCRQGGDNKEQRNLLPAKFTLNTKYLPTACARTPRADECYMLLSILPVHVWNFWQITLKSFLTSLCALP